MPIGRIFDLLDRAADIGEEAVIDKDKANELRTAIQKAREETYRLELQTKTVPWVDGLHKMGRQIISLVSMFVGAALLYWDPEIDPLKLVAILGPGGLYNTVKGRGS